MLDSDLAMLYGCKNGTKSLNLAVKRHINRFPERFMFQLTKEEYSSIYSRFQFETLNKNNQKQGLNIKYLPYVFTEQGIAMLAGVLKNDIAVKVSINIIKSFIEMRKILAVNGRLFDRLTNVEYKLLEHDKKFDKVFDQLQNEENIKQKIFFEGQIYDAYSLIIDIIKKANRKILIIDNYIDDSVLKMLTKKNDKVVVVILTSEKSNIQSYYL